MLQKKIRVAVIVKEIELFEDNLIFIDNIFGYATENDEFETLLTEMKSKIKMKIVDITNEMNVLIKDLKLNGVK